MEGWSCVRSDSEADMGWIRRDALENEQASIGWKDNALLWISLLVHT